VVNSLLDPVLDPARRDAAGRASRKCMGEQVAVNFPRPVVIPSGARDLQCGAKNLPFPNCGIER